MREITGPKKNSKTNKPSATSRKTNSGDSVIAVPADKECRKFSSAVLKWFEQHGRKHLPWQQDVNPYRVWVSEIMLQQTQVTTVIPYFDKFMQRFPDVEALAQATQDQVLQHWSGLGYYARGRNLHKAAQQIVEQHQGRFPQTLEGLIALPGIGRSTAGAVLSLACGKDTSILDGNVKRVLCRHFTVDGWYGNSAVEKHLWQLTDALTPSVRTGEYNQAMMDLGATLCTRSSPRCDRCPVVKSCLATATGVPANWPHKKPKKEKPQRKTWMLIVEDPAGDLLMERRPPSGIWGGLWGFPQFESSDAALEYAKKLGTIHSDDRSWPTVEHTFSHFHLQINPLHVRLKTSAQKVMDREQVWHRPGSELGGFAAPVSQLLAVLAKSDCL